MDSEDPLKLETEICSLAVLIEKKRVITSRKKELNGIMEILIRFGKRLDEEYVKETVRFGKLKDDVERLGLCYM